MLSLAKNTIFIALVAVFFTACSYIRLPSYPDSSRDFKGSPNTSSASQQATMRPYTINGKTYYPTTVNIGDTADGIASWYGPNFHGKKTSNGETYNMNAMTAAHKTLPMNTMVRVINLRNNRTTTVRINDRGPFVAGRIIDLSKAAASAIDMLGTGTAPVKLEVVGFYGNTSSYSQGSSVSSGGFGAGTGVSGGIISRNSKSNNTSNSQANSAKSQNVPAQSSTDTFISGGNFMVQLGAFRNEAGAISYKNKYNGTGGYSTVIKVYEDGGSAMHRVFLQGFRSEAEARDFIDSHGLGGAFIVRD